MVNVKHSLLFYNNILYMLLNSGVLSHLLSDTLGIYVIYVRISEYIHTVMMKTTKQDKTKPQGKGKIKITPCAPMHV